MPRKATVWIILRHFDKILVHAKYMNRSLYFIEPTGPQI